MICVFQRHHEIQQTRLVQSHDANKHGQTMYTNFIINCIFTWDISKCERMWTKQFLKYVLKQSGTLVYTKKVSPSGPAIFLPSIPMSKNMISVDFDLHKLSNHGSLLLTRINFCPSMNKLSQVQKSVIWNSFSNFYGLTAELWEWINNSTTHLYIHVITYPCRVNPYE